VEVEMNIVQVYVRVKPEHIDAFTHATIENARNSREEPGVARFDFLQKTEDPGQFLLTEVYKDDEAPKKHKETDHYLKWRETVEGMMAEPRQGVKYTNIFPGDDDW
jgi:(4S)-4-hydroxy-5-phosphonooxypentane-2,3-dione isomerase